MSGLRSEGLDTAGQRGGQGEAMAGRTGKDKREARTPGGGEAAAGFGLVA